MALLLAGTALAQDVATPNFWDQRQRLAKPSLPNGERIRFLTSVDYPPFNFLDQNGRLTGFNIDLVRAVCDVLAMLNRCQIEARPFADLAPALLRGDADAVIAGVAMTAAARRDLDFTGSYFRYPARFVTPRDVKLAEPIDKSVGGRRIGVVRGSAHAAMLRSFFPAAIPVEFDDRETALATLRHREIAAFFGDGVSLSFWLDSEAAADCCAFAGGPFLSDRFLGEGLAIAAPKQNRQLVQALDYAIGQVVATGKFSELLLRYFPASAF